MMVRILYRDNIKFLFIGNQGKKTVTLRKAQSIIEE